ncbi:MAG: ribose 5-phosphate isomerase B [Pseudomonadota bacterium]|nr:ribose 5-phosphate isomerase B [Pseudomonadota bacterium]
MKKTIFIASDHAGLSLKTFFINNSPQFEWVDLGPHSEASVDYPDFADILVREIKTPSDLGVLICGSGQGMSMRANKYSHIRAALCWNEETAKLAREHNNANVLCFGARLISTNLAHGILETFMKTEFAGGRHEQRVTKISSNPQKKSEKGS